MIQNIKKCIIKLYEKLGVYQIDSLGGTSKANYISVKGLYSKSIKENGLVLQILNDEGNKVVIPLQKAINLENGDVILTDDNNKIHFKYNSKIIDILGNINHKGNTTQNGNVTLTGNTTQNGNVTLTGDLTQNGNQTLTGNVDLTGNETITGDITQQGNQTITGNIVVTGSIILNGVPL